MAHSSKVEYEIGLLIVEALQKVGDLIQLDGQRITMHRTLSSQSPESLDMLVVRPALRHALHEAFNYESAQFSTATAHLTSHQLQELGAKFGRDPSSLGTLVQAMWYSGSRYPDFMSIVTPSSNLLVA
jgi:hypothetical protein